MNFQLGVGRLDCRTLCDISQNPYPALEIADSTLENVAKFRGIVESALESKKAHYGINTGFGFLSDVKIDVDKLEQLQTNLIRSHACGVGQPISPQLTRALMILRAHTFCLGHTGISPKVVKHIVKYLEQDLLPLIPDKGSVGASGDLAPLAHLAMGLMGEGKALYNNEVRDVHSILKKLGISPIKPQAKEGLSLINGTHFMTTIAAFAAREAEILVRSADIISAMTLDALRGTLKPFDERIHKLRPHYGQQHVARRILSFFDSEDEILRSHQECGKVQDPYSLRCIPQVHGASYDTTLFVTGIVDRELNSVTDNPLCFEGGDILSGGNFHGQPVALAMDFLAIAIAELGSISERRIEKITNPHLSGLPAFGTTESGLNSGLMIPHVVAASLVSENKVLAHPASVDSIPTSADKEDHVSMGPIAARKAREINRNVSYVLAIELLSACQGIDLLKPLKPSTVLYNIYKKVRSISEALTIDRSLSGDIEKLSEWILSGELLKTKNI